MRNEDVKPIGKAEIKVLFDSIRTSGRFPEGLRKWLPAMIPKGPGALTMENARGVALLPETAQTLTNTTTVSDDATGIPARSAPNLRWCVQWKSWPLSISQTKLEHTKEAL